MKVSITATGDSSVSRHLTEIGRRAANAQPVLERIASDMEGDLARNFRSRGSLFGSWRGGADLVESGGLASSLSGGAGSVRSVTDGSATVGTSLFYARFHHIGAGVPKRPLVGITRQRSREAATLIGRYIAR